MKGEGSRTLTLASTEVKKDHDASIAGAMADFARMCMHAPMMALDNARKLKCKNPCMCVRWHFEVLAPNGARVGMNACMQDVKEERSLNALTRHEGVPLSPETSSGEREWMGGVESYQSPRCIW